MLDTHRQKVHNSPTQASSPAVACRNSLSVERNTRVLGAHRKIKGRNNFVGRPPVDRWTVYGGTEGRDGIEGRTGRWSTLHRRQPAPQQSRPGTACPLTRTRVFLGRTGRKRDASADRGTTYGGTERRRGIEGRLKRRTWRDRGTHRQIEHTSPTPASSSAVASRNSLSIDRNVPAFGFRVSSRTLKLSPC